MSDYKDKPKASISEELSFLHNNGETAQNRRLNRNMFNKNSQNVSNVASFSKISSQELINNLNLISKNIFYLSTITPNYALHILNGTTQAYAKLSSILLPNKEFPIQIGKNTEDLINSLRVLEKSGNTHDAIKLSLLIAMENKINNAIPEIQREINIKSEIGAPSNHAQRNVVNKSSSKSQEPMIYLSKPQTNKALKRH